jgi:hypothetical protein
VYDRVFTFQTAQSQSNGIENMEQQGVSRWTLVFAGSVLISFLAADFTVYGTFTWPIFVAGTISALPLFVRALRPPHDFFQTMLCFLGGLFLGGTALALAAPDQFFIPRVLLTAILLYYGFCKPDEEDVDHVGGWWDDSALLRLDVVRLLAEGSRKGHPRR